MVFPLFERFLAVFHLNSPVFSIFLDDSQGLLKQDF